MDSLAAWLAAMPVEAVQARIRELETELAGLRTLERQHKTRNRQEQVTDSRAVTTQAPQSRRRLSPQREAILEVIAQHPDGVGPAHVWRTLVEGGMEIESNAVQTNMSRMVQAGLIRRLGQGLYTVASNTPTPSLLNGSTGGDEG